MLVKEKDGRLFVLEAEEKSLFSGIPLRIMRLLSEGESYPKEMARWLKVDEQKVYYHVRQLERKGFIRLAAREEKGGALAKIYRVASPAFFVRFSDFQEAKRIPRSAEGFEPFVKGGKLDAKIIVGSPDPHGPEGARSRDVSFAVDLALFLGTFLTRVEKPVVMEDKDVHEHDLGSNLIIIGGPVTNKVTKMINEKMPVRFDRSKNIVSAKKTYKQDECGFVVRAENPYAKGKKIILIAGKRYSGTKAAVLAFIQKFDGIKRKNYIVVEGIDEDGDGDVDNVRVLE